MKLKEIIPQYIAYRRSLGEKFNTSANLLNSFLEYMGGETGPAEINSKLCTGFLYAPGNTVTAIWFGKYTALKGFFSWAVSREYIPIIPLPVDIPKRPQGMVPYIYTGDELKRLFSTALTFQTNHSHIYPEVVRVALIVTYTLGLRLHETMSLKIKDVDLKNSLVYINESKFYKSRIVPFNESIKQLFADFMEWRIQHDQSREDEKNLLLDRRMMPMKADTLRGCFKRICKKANIYRTDASRYQPRIHDLRYPNKNKIQTSIITI
jgi:site-specific recombinase XerD